MLQKDDNSSREFAFSLTSDWIRKAHNIYKKNCFFQYFFYLCAERRKDETGLCNLPYETILEETELLRMAYSLFEKFEDKNVAYNATLNCVIDEIERRIANGTLRPQADPSLRVALVIEDGIVTASYTSDPSIRIEVTKLDKGSDSHDEREAVYSALEHDPELSECECYISWPGYEEDDCGRGKI